MTEQVRLGKWDVARYLRNEAMRKIYPLNSGEEKSELSEQASDDAAPTRTLAEQRKER